MAQRGAGDFIKFINERTDTLQNADSIYYNFSYDFTDAWDVYLIVETQRAGGSGADTVIIETHVSLSPPDSTAIWKSIQSDTIIGTGTQVSSPIDFQMKGRRLRFLARKTTLSKSTKPYIEGVLRRRTYR